ncbi:MAG: hypothetical protein IPL26_13450 [Leptospiraceae bacterium]|nr:hypothetical protein [Leptospiraceae bacterium]
MNQTQINRYKIIQEANQFYARDYLLDMDSMLYESKEFLQEAIDTDTVDFDFSNIDRGYRD